MPPIKCKGSETAAPVTVSPSDALTASVPELAFTLTVCCAIKAAPDAEKVKVPVTLGVRDRDAGETVTPVGKVAGLTDTVPVKPFCAVTETWTAWLAPP